MTFVRSVEQIRGLPLKSHSITNGWRTVNGQSAYSQHSQLWACRADEHQKAVWRAQPLHSGPCKRLSGGSWHADMAEKGENAVKIEGCPDEKKGALGRVSAYGQQPVSV